MTIRAFNIVPRFPDTATTSSFTQTINPDFLTVDIVDANNAPVGSPTVDMNAVTFGFTCQEATGVFPAAGQAIYVRNPDAADNGWVVSLAAASQTSFWNGTGAADMDFNDASGAGCTDGADADSLRGQMTVDPEAGALTNGDCTLGCSTDGVTQEPASSFIEDGDDITILTGAAGSDDIGDWRLTGVGISQTIPAQQAAAGDYTINLTLSILTN